MMPTFANMKWLFRWNAAPNLSDVWRTAHLASAAARQAMRTVCKTGWPFISVSGNRIINRSWMPMPKLFCKFRNRRTVVLLWTCFFTCELCDSVQTALSRRVSMWHEEITRRLDAEDDRRAFKVHNYAQVCRVLYLLWPCSLLFVVYYNT